MYLYSDSFIYLNLIIFFTVMPVVTACVSYFAQCLLNYLSVFMFPFYLNISTLGMCAWVCVY